MDDSRNVMLLSGSTASTARLLTSQTIVPETTGASVGETAGCWRSYGVVFYCDDYARTDLTTCAAANQKMFYVGDPNPNSAFGTTAAHIGGGSTSGGATAGGTTSGGTFGGTST